MELFAVALSNNPKGECKLKELNLSQIPTIMKEGAKLLAPGLAVNKSLVSLDLSQCKMGVSGVVHIAQALETNSTLESLNLYRNILDVDGARALAKSFKVNNTLKWIDIGHNRIRATGLKAIVDSVSGNASSKLNTLAVRGNFINDDGISYLLEKLVVDRVQLRHVYLKYNFLSEYHKIELAKDIKSKGIQVYVDEFDGVDVLEKSRLDRTIWISPMV